MRSLPTLTLAALVAAGLVSGTRSASASAASPAPTVSAAPAVPAAFAPLAFLLGTWSGGGTSDAGSGSGTDAFALDVANRVVVRRSHAAYPATADHAASTYDAMMMIYQDPAYPSLRGDYVDNGGHAIHYSYVPSADPRVAQFVSDPAPNAPRFKLTYTDAADDRSMQVLFQMQPPGGTEYTVTIATGTETRQSH